MRRTLTAVLCVPLLLLAGCSSSPHAAAARSVDVIRAAPVLGAVRDDGTGAEPAEASCTDVAGDGGDFDIRSVAVERVGDRERVTVQVTAIPEIRSDQTASVIVVLFGRTGDRGAALTTRWRGGERTVSEVGLDGTNDRDVADDTRIVGTTIEMTYPAELIDRAGGGWQWMAATRLKGSQTDSCMNAAWNRARF